MKKTGITLISLGIAMIFLAFNMDVTNGISYNIGLLNERQNIIYLSGVLLLSGSMFFGFGFVAKEEVNNIKAFALWTFFTPIILLIAIKVVVDIQNSNLLEEIRLEKMLKEVIEAQTLAKAVEEDANKFIDNKDGTVTIKSSGLMWQKCSVGQTWTGTICNGEVTEFYTADAEKLTSTFANYNDWRLPTIDELKTLIYCKNSNYRKDIDTFFCEETGIVTINESYFPNTSTAVQYLSSSFRSLGYDGLTKSMDGVAFNLGAILSNPNNYKSAVRLVRK